MIFKVKFLQQGFAQSPTKPQAAFARYRAKAITRLSPAKLLKKVSSYNCLHKNLPRELRTTYNEKLPVSVPSLNCSVNVPLQICFSLL